MGDDRLDRQQLEIASCVGLICHVGMMAEVYSELSFLVAYPVASPPLIVLLITQREVGGRYHYLRLRISAGAWYFGLTSSLLVSLFLSRNPWPNWWLFFLVGIALGAIPWASVFIEVYLSAKSRKGD